MAFAEMCWELVRGAACGKPAVGLDEDRGIPVCEEHEPRRARLPALKVASEECAPVIEPRLGSEHEG